MIWESFDTYTDLSARAAAILLETIRHDPSTVLGLPTGRSPIGMYDKLITECAAEYRCFHEVTTFNLDEYVGIPRTHPASYYTFMKQHLFDHVDVDPMKTNIPNGCAPDPAAECRRYEAVINSAGGIRLTFLGLGRNGHIGFNEPGTPFNSRTRVVELTASTREANASFFPDSEVPRQAITMGIATILESRAIVLLVSGGGKGEAIERLRSGVIDEDFPASALWNHPNVRVLVRPAL